MTKDLNFFLFLGEGGGGGQSGTLLQSHLYLQQSLLYNAVKSFALLNHIRYSTLKNQDSLRPKALQISEFSKFRSLGARKTKNH